MEADNPFFILPFLINLMKCLKVQSCVGGKNKKKGVEVKMRFQP